MENLIFLSILMPGCMGVFYYILKLAIRDYNDADCPEMKFNAAVGILGSVLALVISFISLTYIVMEWVQ